MASKTWIRDPLWDSLWIVNGPLLGLLALIASHWVSPFHLLIVPAIFVQKAHNLAPIYHAWGRRDFREIMLRDKQRFLWIPLATLLACLFAGLMGGLATSGDQLLARIPYCAMILIALWNLHHFAAQNFGLMSVYRNRLGASLPRQRILDKFYCFFMMLVLVPLMVCTAKSSPFFSGFDFFPASLFPATEAMRSFCILTTLSLTVAMIAHEWRATSWPRVLMILQVGLPTAIGFWQPLFFWTSVAVNHWFVSIGINAHVHAAQRRRGFPAEGWFVVLAVAGYLMLMPFSLAAYDLLTAHLFPYHLLTASRSERVVRSMLITFFSGQAAVHFLYDRALFKLSRPEVRETIGRDLIAT